MTQSLAFRYVEALGAACRECNIKDFSLVQGASEEDLNRLREKFQDVPETLIQLLSLVDGTYYRKYKEKEVCVAVFDGVDGDIPYYLNSVEQILKQNAPSIAAMYGDPDPEDRASPEYLSEFMDMVGEGIDPFQPFGTMLHLSDCTNNGGSSALYIDFHPAEGGVKGQIVCFRHDPDSYTVIAPSFDAFLEARLAAGFDWIEPEEDEIPEDPAMTALLEGLKRNNPQAEQQLQHPSVLRQILYIMRAVQTPAVLRACLRRLEDFYAVQDETGHLGEMYRAQYGYLFSEFMSHSSIYMQDAALREEVAAFARKVKYVPLIRQMDLEQTPEEAAELFRDQCDFYYTQERYNALSPEAFFKESALAWQLPSFEEYFDHAARPYRFAAYTPGRRERVLRLDPGWRNRLQALEQLSMVQFAMLADMAESKEDLELLKTRLTASMDDYIVHLARFCHALCLVGEEQVDAHLPWVFEQVLVTIRSNAKLFASRYNEDAYSLSWATEELKKNEATVYNFTFIVSLRLEKSLELLAHIDAMLTEETGKKACASLVRLLKKKIKEAKA